MTMRSIGVRWTVGDVHPRGFEALRLSVWGAWRIFGEEARYAICVNSLPLETARQRTGSLPKDVVWCSAGAVPSFLEAHLDGHMAEGVAWKLAPLRLFPDLWELAFDNDCMLWDRPVALNAWLAEDEPRCVIAGDVSVAFGAFTDLTRPEPRNTGIRGFPPGYDLGRALQAALEIHPVLLRSELDEQGLQVMALDLDRPAHVVATEDVSICAPFWPKKPELGRCGAHFVGLNCRTVPWNYYDRPATEWIEENWQRHRPELYRRVGLTYPT